MDTTLHVCALDDLAELRQLSIETFRETFGKWNTAEDMDAYLRDSFDGQRLAQELEDPCSHFFMLRREGEPAGYLKVNEAPSQTDVNDDASLELERIYVRRAFQGEGLGALMMQRALDCARELGKEYVWLGVWEKNERALRFYEKHGFCAVGTHTFVLGRDRQTDYIMRRDVA